MRAPKMPGEGTEAVNARTLDALLALLVLAIAAYVVGMTLLYGRLP